MISEVFWVINEQINVARADNTQILITNNYERPQREHIGVVKQ